MWSLFFRICPAIWMYMVACAFALGLALYAKQPCGVHMWPSWNAPIPPNSPIIAYLCTRGTQREREGGGVRERESPREREREREKERARERERERERERQRVSE